MRSFPPKKVAGGKTVLFFYDTEGHLVAEVEKVAASDDAARLYVFLEDELIGIVDETEEVGSVRTPIPIPIDLSLPLALLALFAGAGLLVLLVTRRAPLGIATTTSGAALLLLCAQTSGGPLFAWVHVDPLGTPLAVTAGDPAVAVWRASYEPFGKATVSEDPDGDTETFSLAVRLPGQYEDAETGRHFNFLRTYDPQTGRYLEHDPFLTKTALDGYAYARSNPSAYIDRLGLVAAGLGAGHSGAGIPIPGKLGILWDADCYVVVDDDGNVGVLCCAGAGAGTGAGLVAGFQGSGALCPDCDTICDMEGDYASLQGGLGGGAAVAGGGGVSISSSGTTLLGGFGPGGGGGGYLGWVYGRCELVWGPDCGDECAEDDE
jgi:RHS repeat-associated protein